MGSTDQVCTLHSKGGRSSVKKHTCAQRHLTILNDLVKRADQAAHADPDVDVSQGKLRRSDGRAKETWRPQQLADNRAGLRRDSSQRNDQLRQQLVFHGRKRCLCAQCKNLACSLRLRPQGRCRLGIRHASEGRGWHRGGRRPRRRRTGRTGRAAAALALCSARQLPRVAGQVPARALRRRTCSQRPRSGGARLRLRSADVANVGPGRSRRDRRRAIGAAGCTRLSETGRCIDLH